MKQYAPESVAESREQTVPVTRNSRPSTILAESGMMPVGELPAQIGDCWNTIGVGGNASCRELLRFMHCRNCPVYSAAAIQLLDRPFTEDYRREWTDYYAREKKLTTPAKTSLVIFRVASEWLALPTQAFQEVADRRGMHSLPHRRRNVVLGLVNVRGELLVCISLERVLGLVSEERRVTRHGKAPVASHVTRHSSRLLVANWNGNRIAFPVGEVFGIHRVHAEDLHEPPATIAKSMDTFSRGVFIWRDHTVGFLDADSLFSTINRNLT